MRRYPLDEVLLLCLVAVIAGAEAVTEIARFGEKKLDLLRRFRPFREDVPAHDHLGNILASLDSEQFQRCFAAWVASLAGVPEGVVAIDGKTVRRSEGSRAGEEPIHIVSAFAARQRLVLGQVKVADYIFALKGNPGRLRSDDECRLRTNHAPANFITIKHMALNLIRRTPGKESLRLKRKVATSDDGFLASTISRKLTHPMPLNVNVILGMIGHRLQDEQGSHWPQFVVSPALFQAESLQPGVNCETVLTIVRASMPKCR